MNNSRFTDDAKKVIQYAHEAAKDFRHEYIGTEHILLGLARSENCIAGQLLAQWGVTAENISRAIETMVGVGKETPKKVILTPRTKKAIELAVYQANEMRQTYVGTEELLLGLLQDTGCMAIRILESMDVSIASMA